MIKENLLNLDYGRTKTAEEIIAYPKDFILIKKALQFFRVFCSVYVGFSGTPY